MEKLKGWHCQVIIGKNMTSYLAKEVELSRRHEAIVAERIQLLQDMKIQLEQQANEKKNYIQETEAAHKRNQTLLKDLQVAEQSLKEMGQSLPHPTTVSLEDHYWAAVEEEIPKWEQFLLGKAPSPFTIRQKHPSKPKLKNSQSMQAANKYSLPPSGLKSNTFPR
ncbi:centrosomal protein 15 isoform X1 [Ascaphus truei]|uniref:centrosomal protein 15 isoform X1 n=2 Tax=Ascaphus truei TaxID=8439 RepID=UPI003F5A24BA